MSAGSYLYPDSLKTLYPITIMSVERELLLELFSENVVAKALRVAVEALNNNVFSYTDFYCMSLTSTAEPTNRLSRICPPAWTRQRPIRPPRRRLLDLRLLPRDSISPPRARSQIPADLPIPEPRGEQRTSPRYRGRHRPRTHPPLHHLDRPNPHHDNTHRHPRSRVHSTAIPPQGLGTNQQRIKPIRSNHRRPQPRNTVRPQRRRNPQLGCPGAG